MGGHLRGRRGAVAQSPMATGPTGLLTLEIPGPGGDQPAAVLVAIRLS